MQFSDIDMLLNIISSIIDTYANLSKLEEEAKKESYEYKESIDELRRLSSLEDSILKRIKDSDLSEVKKYLEKIFQSDVDLKIFITSDYEKLKEARLVNDLFFILTTDKTKLFFYYLILDLMRLTIKVMEDSDLRNIKNRNVIWFSFKELEIEALGNDFCVPKDTYLVHTIFSDKDVKNSMLLDIYKIAIDNIFKKDEAKKMLSVSLLRATNVLLDEEYSLEIIKSFEKLIFFMDEEEKEVLKSVLDNYESDKKIPSYLSLKRRL